ncbi:MAG TPA: hypothetical protein VEP67_03500 [Thiobacillaceae bacterium]|nr:hypothetical protein [Thiobacillaceae bacterium]
MPRPSKRDPGIVAALAPAQNIMAGRIDMPPALAHAINLPPDVA